MEQQICGVKNRECIDIAKMFWVFVTFCVVGTISEGIYWIIRYGHFDLRTGLVYGPFSPVYGMAITLIVLLLYRYRFKPAWQIFLMSYAIAVGFEFMSSVFQQWIFGYTSWDYSDSRFALLGRANLIYAIPWALFSLLLIKWIYPWFCRILSKFPRKPGVIITWIVLIFMIFNVAVSAAAVYRYQERQQNIPPANAIEEQLDQHYPDAFMEKRFARLGE